MSKEGRKDPSGLTYTQIALRLGISHNAIYVMRRQQSPRFTYIYTLHSHFEKGFRLYQQLQEETLLTLQAMYYQLEDDQLLLPFSRFLHNEGLYGSDISWYNTVKMNYFRLAGTKGMQHKFLLKKLEVLKAYERFDYAS